MRRYGITLDFHAAFKQNWYNSPRQWGVKSKDDRYHPKEVVLGVAVGDTRRAYLGSILTAGGGRIVDEVGGHKVRIVYDSESGTFSWEAPEAVSVTDAYWFAWKSFHPDTEIWHERREAPGS